MRMDSHIQNVAATPNSITNSNQFAFRSIHIRMCIWKLIGYGSVWISSNTVNPSHNRIEYMCIISIAIGLRIISYIFLRVTGTWRCELFEKWNEHLDYLRGFFDTSQTVGCKSTTFDYEDWLLVDIAYRYVTDIIRRLFVLSENLSRKMSMIKETPWIEVIVVHSCKIKRS